jgi:uncharacterized protein YndB with AHSA1/START domain
MNFTIVPAAVKKSVRVAADQQRAFEVFARGMGRWWPKSHSIGSSPQADVVIEPRAGGRWYEKAEDGSECEWGRVLEWDPPGRLLLAWQINGEWKYDAGLVTEVEVRFIREGNGSTLVELEHRNLDRFGDKQEKVAKSIGSDEGWTGLLRTYAKFAGESR